MENFTVTDCNFPAIHLLQGMSFWILFKEKDFPSKSFRTVKIGKKYSKLLLFFFFFFFFSAIKTIELFYWVSKALTKIVCVKSYLSKNKTQREYLLSLSFFFFLSSNYQKYNKQNKTKNEEFKIVYLDYFMVRKNGQ